MQEISRDNYWKYKKSYGVGLFTDLNLYIETVKLARSHGYVNVPMLEKNLPERVIGLKYIETFKKRTFEDLIRELVKFRFLTKKETDYYLTRDGHELLNIHATSVSNYYDIILERMNEEYVIPGWFIFRLWAINPEGQGQVVIPSPIKTWKPEKRRWEDNKWNDELDRVTIDTYNQINRRLSSSFPIELSTWKKKLRDEYERLGTQKQRIIAKKTKENMGKRMEYFAPRGRLTQAMKNVSVVLLFSSEYNSKKDFISTTPMTPRNFMVWCPRLESFELIYYSDYFEEIPGRLLFPCSVYKTVNQSNDYQPIESIKTPDNRLIYRHKPTYSTFRILFLETLVEVYENRYNKEGIIYVSLQQVRDEVCRLLRISAATFEAFLQQSFRDSVARQVDYSIALETDIREDQKSGFQLQRRPVYIDGAAHSLIAIKRFQ